MSNGTLYLLHQTKNLRTKDHIQPPDLSGELFLEFNTLKYIQIWWELTLNTVLKYFILVIKQPYS